MIMRGRTMSGDDRTGLGVLARRVRGLRPADKSAGYAYEARLRGLSGENIQVGIEQPPKGGFVSVARGFIRRAKRPASILLIVIIALAAIVVWQRFFTIQTLPAQAGTSPVCGPWHIYLMPFSSTFSAV